MNSFLALGLAEIIGTAVLIILGNGIGQVTNIKSFAASKNHTWITTFLGWGLAIFVALGIATMITSATTSTKNPPGASLNAAVALFLLFQDLSFVGVGAAFSYLFIRIGFSLLGAGLGQLIIDLLHFKELKTVDSKIVLSTHATIPADSSRRVRNLLNEIIATLIFVLAIVAISAFDSLGFRLLAVSLAGAIVIAVFGSTTGAAINPSRDLAPRLIFQLLPLTKNGERKDAMWSYQWIPIFGPFLGALLAAGFVALLIN